jgi:hypothetical protein
MWETVRSIGTPLTLAAFVVAAGLTAYRYRLRNIERLIRAAPEAERARLVSSALESFAVDPSNLTRLQQYDLALAQLHARSRRFYVSAVVIFLLAVLAAALTAYSLSRDDSPPQGRRCPPSPVGELEFSDLVACFTKEGRILVADNFDRPDRSIFKVREYPEERLSFQGGELLYDRRVDDGSLAGWTVPGTENLANFLLHVTVSYGGGHLEGDPSVAVFLLRQGRENEAMRAGYVVTGHIPFDGPLTDAFVKSHRRGKVSLYERHPGESGFREPPRTSQTVKAETWNRVALFVRSWEGRLQVYWNGEQAFDVDAAASAQGHIMLGAGGRAFVKFDDLVVAELHR